MTTAIVDIGTLITKNPDIRNGQPIIAGTGVTVRRIVGWHKSGMNAEKIATEIGHLSLAQVHAALAYYYANVDEIEAIIDAEEQEATKLEREHHRTAGEEARRIISLGSI